MDGPKAHPISISPKSINSLCSSSPHHHSNHRLTAARRRRRRTIPASSPAKEMHPPLTLHRHPMCAEIIELFQKCHDDHPIKKFFGECTELKIKLDRCFREEKAVKRKANFEKSKMLKERLQAYRKEMKEKEMAD